MMINTTILMIKEALKTIAYYEHRERILWDKLDYLLRTKFIDDNVYSLLRQNKDMTPQELLNLFKEKEK